MALPVSPLCARLRALTDQYAARSEDEKTELFKQLAAQEAARGEDRIKAPSFFTPAKAKVHGFTWAEYYVHMGPPLVAFVVWDDPPTGTFAATLKSAPPAPLDRELFWELCAANGFTEAEDTRIDNLPAGLTVQERYRGCTFRYKVVCWKSEQ